MEIGSWDAAAVIAKALTYAFGLTSAGGALFLLIFAKVLLEDERLGLIRFVCGASALALLLTLFRLPLLAGALGGDMASMWDWSLMAFVLDSSEANAAALRIVGLAMIFGLALGAPPGIAASGALLVAASFALTGHSASMEQGVAARLLVGIHLIGVAYWIGAFYPLARIARGADLPRIARIMKRFGDIAAFAVGGLIAAGVVLLWLMLETPLAIFESAYGRLLAVKLLLVASLLSLAAMNKLRLTPALFAGDATALRRLRTSISAEMMLAAVILAVTAAFTTIVGPPALE